jgi:hypothetical protein
LGLWVRKRRTKRFRSGFLRVKEQRFELVFLIDSTEKVEDEEEKSFIRDLGLLN